MTCAEVQHRLAEGRPTAGDEAHLDTCVDCARVGAEVAGLATLTVAPVDVAALRAGVVAAVSAPVGLRGWLTERPTALRLGAGVLGALVVPLVAGAGALRPDLAVYPRMAYGLVVALLLLVVGTTTARALSPLQTSHRTSTSLAGLLAVLWVAAVCMFPPAHHAHPASLGGVGPDLVPAALGCLLWGLLTSLPAIPLLWALDRRDRPWSQESGAALVAAAGAAAVLGLHLRCPVVAVEHRFLGHATVVAVLLLAMLPVRWVNSRR